jgi:DNA-binding IclR family transcriptional regulator
LPVNLLEWRINGRFRPAYGGQPRGGGAGVREGTGAVALEPLTGDDPGEVARYRLRARLGAGGMGRVYLAFTPAGRPVALKRELPTPQPGS